MPDAIFSIKSPLLILYISLYAAPLKADNTLLQANSPFLELPNQNVSASMLLFSGLKALKKTAYANELENMRSEMRRAEKGALTYGIINLIIGLIGPMQNTTEPIDAMTDATGFTSTYWVVRKLAKQLIESDIGITTRELISWSSMPETYRSTLKQIILGITTHFIYRWSTNMIFATT